MQTKLHLPRNTNRRYQPAGDCDDVPLCRALCVSELRSLNLQETDLERGNTLIKGTGKREEEIAAPAPVIDAIRRYLVHRGTTAGSLFRSRGERGKNREGRRHNHQLFASSWLPLGKYHLAHTRAA